MLQFLRTMPKVELHAHLGGSIPRQALKQLLTSQGHLAEAQKLDTADLQVEGFFNSLFAGSAKAMETREGLRRTVGAVLQAFVEDGVVYLELRTTPRAGKDYSLVDYFNTIVEESRKHPDLELRLIVSLNRGVKDTTAYSNLIPSIQLISDWKKYVVGIDFSGDPRSRTFKQFIPLLLAARVLGLCLTIHTAQVESQLSETADILSVRPDRIGHLNYFSEEELAQIKTLGIVVEVCISSNVVVKQLASELEHHVGEFLQSGVRHCLGSDDMLLFGNSLSEEYEKYARIVKVGERECYRLAKTTVQYMSDQSVKDKILGHFRLFEEKWKEKYPFLGDQHLEK